MISGIIIAFDFGTKNIGVAIGQRITCTGWPISTIKARDGIPNWKEIENIFKIWQPDIFIVGLPLNLQGKEQLITQRARKFANRLRYRFGISVIMQDERFSTVESRSNLFKRSGYKSIKKNKIDSGSAVIILESWLTQFSK